MKIVVLPGVGVHNPCKKYDDFTGYLRNQLNCEVEMCYWKHDWPLPTGITLPVKKMRLWTYEVILDFQQVITHCYNMQIPKADYYVAHSAGSILALAQENISCVTFGSPAILVECLHRSINSRDNQITISRRILEAMRGKRNIYNIINEYDPLAYYIDLPNTENFTFKNAWYKPTSYEPFECHIGYWDNDITKKKTVEMIKKWESA